MKDPAQFPAGFVPPLSPSAIYAPPRETLNAITGSIVDAALRIHRELGPGLLEQLLAYLRVADERLGLLINFNVEYLKNGITRIVNGQQE